MAYVKQTWINNDPTTPLNATRLNKIEDGIANAHDIAEQASNGLVTLEAFNTALAGKANTSHTHAANQITGTLDDARIPNLAIGKITGLQSAIDGKAATSHTHTIGNVTGLQDAIDGKADSSHTHTIANVTGLQSALDAITGRLDVLETPDEG